MNDNERESAVLKSAMRLVSPSSRTVPLSQWSVPSLVVLRGLELAGVNADDRVLGGVLPTGSPTGCACPACPVTCD